MARMLSLLVVLILAAPAAAQPNRGECGALFFLPDGSSAVAVGLDDKLHVYEAATGKERFAVDAHQGGCFAAALSPDGRQVATGGGDNSVRLWDAAKFKELRKFDGHQKEVLAVAFSPDGKKLASGGSDRTIRVWDVATGKELFSWHGHEQRVLGLAFSPDGKLLASAGAVTATIPGVFRGVFHSDFVRLWDPSTGKEIRKHTLRGSVVAFSPDGRALAAGGTYATGHPLEGGGVVVNSGTLGGISPVLKDGLWTELKGIGGEVAYSPDGRLLAVVFGGRIPMGRFAYDNDTSLRRISVWETATGKEIMQLPQDNATLVAISPTGKKLAAAYVDGTVQFWDLTPPNWAHGDKTPNLEAKDFDKLWAALAEEPAGPAHLARWTLMAVGAPAVAFFKDKVQPEKALAAGQVAELLAKLDSDKYAVREAGFRDLKNLGPVAEAELRNALEGKISPEASKRIQKLLDAWEKRPTSPEELRQVRAMQVLESIGSAEARAVLTRMAEGSPGAWLTVQAQLALKRLERRQ